MIPSHPVQRFSRMTDLPFHIHPHRRHARLKSNTNANTRPSPKQQRCSPNPPFAPRKKAQNQPSPNNFITSPHNQSSTRHQPGLPQRQPEITLIEDLLGEILRETLGLHAILLRQEMRDFE